MGTPVIIKNRGISPIWTLPLIALLLCIWVLFRSFQNAGIEITIYFDDASGITPGKTQVIAKGIPVGLVKEVHADLDQHRIRTIVKMDKETEKYLVEDTLFWVVRPEISAARIRGLETILSGSYIDVQTGTSKTPAEVYTGLSSPPPISEEAPGLHLLLRASALHSIQEGSGIYYKNIQIGSVQRYSLGEDKNILINLYIKPEYIHLVREGSRFSNASGISLTGKLTNLKVRVESLASLIMGGIVLYTPEELKDTPRAKNGHIFSLYKDIEAAQYGLQMTLQLASGAGIVEGVTKVRYRGLDAGIVEKVTINSDKKHTVTAHILLDPRAEIILRQGTKFWIVEPKIDVEGIKNLNTLISGTYITFKPGSGPFTSHFEVLPSPPSLDPLRPGTEYILTIDTPGSLAKGAPVLFKKIKVGEITKIDLAEDEQSVEMRMYIYEQYNHLIKKTSVFWDTSGIRVDVNLAGIKVETGSLGSILRGGVSFKNPTLPKGKNAPLAEGGDRYLLHTNYRDAVKNVPAIQPPGYYFRIRAKNIGPYKPGSPILYKKVEVGEVLGFSFSKKHQDVLIDCFIQQPYVNMVNSRSRFFDFSGIQMEGNLTGFSMQTGSMESILSGGIGFITPFKADRPKKNTIYPLYTSREAAVMAGDVQLTVYFNEISSLRVGSLVKYKGITVGKVSEIAFANDLDTIVTKLHVKKKVASFFRESTRIWLATSKFKLTEIRNVDTIISGPYITFAPGTGQQTTTFTALSNRPQPEPLQKEGLNLLLVSKNLGSLTIDSPVYFRQVQVGRVTGFKLSDTFQDVIVHVNIEEPYMPIIRENTRFWNVSGTQIEGGLFSGVKVKMESLEALLAGGIAFATPGKDKIGKPAQEHHRFKLHKRAKSEWLDWNPEIILLEEDTTKNPGEITEPLE